MMFATRKGKAVCAALLVAVLASKVAAASPAMCDMRLSIELTPDVPEPPDSGFLSSLLNNQVSYRLTLLGRQSGSVIVTELAGPGPEYRCRNVVEAMRKDGRVLSIHVDQEIAMSAGTDSVAAQAVTVEAGRFVPEGEPDVQPPLDGLASLYWAARHPARAWRVFLPIWPDDVPDATPKAPAEPADVGANAAPLPDAHNTGG
jgi:hypothetical protein